MKKDTFNIFKSVRNQTNQYYKNIGNSILLFLLILFLDGCHHTKTITQTDTTNTTTNTSTNTVKPAVPSVVLDPNVQAIFTNLKSNELPFKELSAKLKTKVISASLNQSFTTNIRWKKGEKIWLSMSIIGIEGARVLITKDSIKIMDKINNRYILKPLSYIKQKTLVDLTFTDIENLLLGQLIFIDSAKTKYANNPTNITLTSDGTRFLTSILLDKNTKKPSSIFVTDKKYAQTIESIYADYQPQLGKSFSMDRDLKIKSGLEIFQMIAKFQSIEIKQNLEYPFTINSSYTIEK